LELPSHYTLQEASTLRTPFYRNGELVRLTVDMDLAFMIAAGPGELAAREYIPLTRISADICAANEAAGLVLPSPSTGSNPQPHPLSRLFLVWSYE
jgi:hypothetical protein